MPIAPLTEEALKEERRREEEERKWFAEENLRTREYQLKIEKLKADATRERTRELKRYIHAIVILKLFKREVPKQFYKHL